MSSTVGRRRDRVIEAANKVAATRKTKDGHVLVPMATMLDLQVSLLRLNEARQEKLHAH